MEYRQPERSYRGVLYQELFERLPGLGASVRYLELAACGHTTLERHRHAHAVIVLVGTGRALVGSKVVELARHDLVFIPPWEWHQVRAGSRTKLGLLCVVDAVREESELPSRKELELLLSEPTVKEFLGNEAL